ncbi:hypothetical protein JZO78_11250 [Enterococcus ureilyticus]|uniref:cupin domain-containing protein n=1 Tax=Enterococcus ureilyticus TaxID=1131292 RepID=UPI001A91C7C4|nr:cupin domain-containing protein [Enterococcus ureilyticus]MBO0446923.1 hypothetical protein [Enterococcus ureilyticus]
MKKLICAKDIEKLHSKKEQVIFIDKETIITPSAKDLAEDYQMSFKMGVSENKNLLANTQKVSKEYLVTLLKKLLKEAGITDFTESPFEYQEHSGGLKIIRGSTVKLSPLNNENNGLRYQEILTSEENNFELGILEIENSQFYQEDRLESVNYVVNGELHVTIDGITYDAYQGDIVFAPKHSAICWSTTSKVTILSGKFKSEG